MQTKEYNRDMASVEITTIQVTVDVFEEQLILASAERAWNKMAEMPAEEFALDGALTDEEIAQLQPDET